jgi:uncharacterized protein YegL
MKPLLNGAIGIAKCQKSGKIYAVRVEERGKKWYATWAFKIREEVAKREGYNEQSFPSDIQYDKEYPGCPHCKKFEELKTGGTAQPASVYLAVDLSGSMSGDPLDEAKKAMVNFVNQMDSNQVKIGIITFADKVSNDLPLTNDYRKVIDTINSFTIGGYVGYGNAAEPFTTAYPIFRSSEEMRYILVLTDGEWCDLDESMAIAEAKKCHAIGVEVIALGFGSVKKAFLDSIASSKEYSKLTTLNNLSDAFTGFADDIGGRKK